jgi:hypothetical protein
MTQWCLRLAMVGIASASLRARNSLPLEEVAAVVDAINSSNEPFTVRFEDLTFKGKAPGGS